MFPQRALSLRGSWFVVDLSDLRVLSFRYGDGLEMFEKGRLHS